MYTLPTDSPWHKHSPWHKLKLNFHYPSYLDIKFLTCSYHSVNSNDHAPTQQTPPATKSCHRHVVSILPWAIQQIPGTKYRTQQATIQCREGVATIQRTLNVINIHIIICMFITLRVHGIIATFSRSIFCSVFCSWWGLLCWSMIIAVHTVIRAS